MNCSVSACRNEVKQPGTSRFCESHKWKENVGGRITKGVGKTVGNTTQGVFGTLTMLTGGLTAPLMLGFGMVGAAISSSSEKYRYCAECRRK